MEKLSFYIAKAMRKFLQPPAKRSSKIDKTSKICSGSQINNVVIRRYSYVGHDCFLNYVNIGSFCSIADDVHMGGVAHNLESVSTSPVFFNGKNIMKKNFAQQKNIEPSVINVGNDVWIGQGAFIKGGVTIGDGAVIGMGAILTKDVGPYEIWAGNPARLIRKRFDDDKIDKLLASKWWEFSDEELMKYGNLFANTEDFLGAISK